jgi:pimeloyl-ACP methyl ester carboxylesterase
MWRRPGDRRRAGIRLAMTPRLAVLAALLLALVSPAAAQQPPGCAQDPSRWAGPPGRCLAMTSHGAARGALLVVVLHGDLSGGAPATYHRALADRIARELPGAAVFALVRPGYPDGEGRTSDGLLNARVDHYTAANMAIVAGAIAALKARTGARRVVAVGHSGGAATAANVLALHPGTLDAAALIACPCGLTAWRVGRSPWSSSVDPWNEAGRIPPTARIAAFTGARDTNTRPQLGADYAAMLARRGIAARFTEVPGAGHNDVVEAMWNSGFGAALAELARP